MKYTVTIIIFLLGKGVYLFISVFVFLLPIHISLCCCGFTPGTSSTSLICNTAVIFMELCRDLKTMQSMCIWKNKQCLHVIVHLLWTRVHAAASVRRLFCGHVAFWLYQNCPCIIWTCVLRHPCECNHPSAEGVCLRLMYSLSLLVSGCLCG